MKLRSMFSPIATVLLGLGAYPMSYGNAPVEVPTEPAAPAGWRCLRAPEVVRMRPTQQAPGSRATMTLTQPPAPFGIAVDTDGHQTYDVRVVIDQLRRREGSHYVVWAATPELDQSVRIGPEEFQFATGESIRTEHSHKYAVDQFVSMAEDFELEQVWTDRAEQFAVLLLRVGQRGPGGIVNV